MASIDPNATALAWLQSFLFGGLLQSTIVILVGLFAARVYRSRGAAVESAILHCTLITVFIAPLASWACSLAGLAPVSLPSLASPIAIVEDDLPTAPLAVSSGGAPAGTMTPTAVHPLIEPVVPTVAMAAMSAPVEPKSARATLAMLLMGVWLALASLLAVRLIFAFVAIDRVRRRAEPATSSIGKLCAGVARDLCITRPWVLVSPDVVSPCLAGCWRPVVLLPRSGVAISREILVHELAHLTRRDCLWNVLSRIAEIVYCLQPLVWYLTRRIELVADEACDDFVVAYSNNRRSYAGELLALAEEWQADWRVVMTTSAVFKFRSELGRRIARILDRSRKVSLTLAPGMRWTVTTCCVSVTIVAGLAGASPAQHENPREGVFSDRLRERLTEGTSDGAKLVFQGRVVDSSGRPRGAEVFLVPNGIGGRAPVMARAISGSAGLFTLESAHLGSATMAKSSPWADATVIARDRDCPIAWAPAARFERTGALEDDTEVGGRLNRRPIKSLRLPVSGPSVTGVVRDSSGKPIHGAHVRLIRLQEGRIDGSLEDWRRAVAAGDAGAAAQFLSDLTLANAPVELTSRLPTADSDTEGRFTLEGIGNDRIAWILVKASHFETRLMAARTAPGGRMEFASAHRRPDPGVWHIEGPALTAVLRPSVTIQGTVRDDDTGAPVAGVQVASTENLEGVLTDGNGRFAIDGLPMGGAHRLTVRAPARLEFLPVTREVRGEGRSITAEFRLKRSLFGVIPTVGAWSEE